MRRPASTTTVLCALWATWLLAACATPVIGPAVRETDDLARVADDALELAAATDPDRVLVVFDIDNTLLAMEQDLGSDQWYEWQKRRAEEDPCDARLVTDRLAVQGALYFASAMRLTQPDAAAQVRRLQDAGLPVIALTSRGVDFRLPTFRELRRNGFDFRRSALGPGHGWPDDFLPGDGARPVRYEDGVFLTTGQHKGDMLQDLLRRTGSALPRVVVMADDKQANLGAVTETFGRLGVPVRAWRYTREDRKVASFDADQSHAQWRDLQPALTAIQRVLGPDNFRLPVAAGTGCE
jgi:hypothetical protein